MITTAAATYGHASGPVDFGETTISAGATIIVVLRRPATLRLPYGVAERLVDGEHSCGHQQDQARTA
jgi:hypothetical protein